MCVCVYMIHIEHDLQPWRVGQHDCLPRVYDLYKYIHVNVVIHILMKIYVYKYICNIHRTRPAAMAYRAACLSPSGK